MEIRLVALEQTDLRQLQIWRNDDRLRHGFREYRLLSMNNQHDWFNHISQSREVEMFGIVAHPSGALVGVCGFCNINWANRTAEVSLYIAPDCQDKDIGLQARELLRQRAFDELNLHRLYTEVYSFRTERIVLLEQCGYIYEGTLRQHVFKQGQYHDSLIYGLLREEA